MWAHEYSEGRSEDDELVAFGCVVEGRGAMRLFFDEEGDHELWWGQRRFHRGMFVVHDA